MTDRHERAIFWVMAVVCAATRFLAMAQSAWEWDEILFCHALRDYDVAAHHPHPPGFPVFIAAAKLVRLVVDSDFRALQALNLIAGVLLFPAMFALAREVRLPFRTSIAGATLLAFFPNVWFFGGGAFSDIPSLTLVLFALTFLFRGWRTRGDYWLGTLLLALATGIRPQNLLIGLFAGGVATIIRGRQSLKDVVVALFIGIVVVVAAFGGAMYAGEDPESFLSSVRGHSDYIARVDSFRNPERPPLWRLFDRFFIRQYQSPVLSAVISIFVLMSAVGSVRDRNRSIGYVVASFAPLAILAWLMLDRFSISRFSIGYAPMFAFLAADGIARATRRLPRAEPVLAGALVAGFIAYTAPALDVVRKEVTPPVRALETATRVIDPSRHDFLVAFNMFPYVDYLAPRLPYIRVLDDRALPLTIGSRQPVLLAEMSEQPGGQLFRRERTALWNIARRHYFEVVLKPIPNLPHFVWGWHPAERSGREEWRWMAGNSVTTLPPAAGDTVLRLHLVIPPELLPQQPMIAIQLNGKLLERFTPSGPEVLRDYHIVPAAGGAVNTLELSTDRTVWDSATGRDRGIRLQGLSWGPG